MKKNLTFLDRMMMAVTFAEANERDSALEISGRSRHDSARQGDCRAKGLSREAPDDCQQIDETKT
jgi:hypothetical protein